MKKRVISAVVALIIIIPLIFLGDIPYYIGVGFIGLIGMNELIDIKEREKKIPIYIKGIAIINFAYFLLNSIYNKYNYLSIDYHQYALLIITLILPILFYTKSKKYDINDALYLIGSTIFLGISFNLLITIRNINLYYLLYIMLITIMSDTFAHFFGIQIGKYKLCPEISPNKTIEGFLGGTIFGTFIGTIFYITAFEYNSLLIVILISLLISISSSVGDLLFSSIKRYFKVKDFGNIMPGHGGILDRLDSILFSLLVFSVIMNFL